MAVSLILSGAIMLVGFRQPASQSKPQLQTK
jgi:hypothetical protein